MTTLKWLFPVSLCGVLTCGLMAGIFFTFSVFAMKAFSRLPAHEGIAAMNSINREIQNPLFFLVFFGATGASILVLIFSYGHWREPAALCLIAGGMLYLMGSFLVTIVFNVPMNDALAAVKPASAEGAKVWANYLMYWTLWNHVRTVTSIGATVAFALSLYFRAKS